MHFFSYTRLTAVFLLSVALVGAANAATKRVLLVHSFGAATPPFSKQSNAFESTLIREMGVPLDIDQVSMDMERYAQPDMQKALVDFLQKRLSHWQPDLIVPFASPACRFIAQNRKRLFPHTPVIYTGCDRRLLPPDALRANATFVGEYFNLVGLIQDIFQLAPGTTRVALIFGASPLERFWADACRRAFQPFSNRVQFTFFNDLNFANMMRQVAAMPPHSFVLYGLFIRDADGVTYKEHEALERLHATANAPINGVFESEMGLGIVGGHLYREEEDGVQSARVAIRILRGEPAADIPPQVIERTSPTYDGRELQRWGIGEKHLPPGSAIRFREPTLWDRYRWWILLGFLAATVETALIIMMAVNLTCRRRMERMLRESESRFRTVADSAPVLIWMSGLDKGCTFFNKAWLDFSGRTAEQEAGNGWVEGVHPDDLAECLKTYETAFDARQSFKIQYRLRRHDGEYRWITDHGVARYDAQGNFAGYIGSCLDMTDWRNAELETQRLRQELIHISRLGALGELTAAITHELTQPLTAIFANALAARNLINSGSSNREELGSIIRGIMADQKRARRVIDNVQSLLKKDAAERIPLQFNELIQDVVSVVRSDAVLRNVSIRLDLDPRVPLVAGDRVQLQQMILNLVMNAFEAMGDVTGRPRELTLTTRAQSGAHVQMHLSDTGSGIPPEKLTEIFETFVTTKPARMGIGLSVSRSIATAHRGWIWAENNPQGGAVFHLILPVIGNHIPVGRPMV